MKNLNPLYENLMPETKRIFKSGIKKTIKNRSKIKKYLERRWNDESEDSDKDE